MTRIFQVNWRECYSLDDGKTRRRQRGNEDGNLKIRKLTAMAEFVVPRSMPTTLARSCELSLFFELDALATSL
jgi:hypothetical protein